jgi:hypothetical protein
MQSASGAAWTPATYLRHLNSRLPVPIEAQWAVALPGFKADAFADRNGAQDITHQIRKGLPMPPWPPQFGPDDDPFDVYHRALEIWDQADIIESHCFNAKLAELIVNPICPICGRDEGSHQAHVDAQTEAGKMAYRAIVTAWSEKALRTFERERCEHRRQSRLHLDHIYPVSLGFQNGVAEEIISSPINLQVITETENLRKHVTPGMSLDELHERYSTWVVGNPIWTNLVSCRRATNAWPRSPLAKVPQRYASADDRDEAHRQCMQPVYLLWEHGYTKKEIAPIIAMWESTLSGRIQLDKKYLGESSVFFQTFPRSPLPPETIADMRAHHRRLRDIEERERRKKDRAMGGLTVITNLRAGETRVEGGH